MSMPRFTAKDLLCLTAVVAIHLFALQLVYRGREGTSVLPFLLAVLIGNAVCCLLLVGFRSVCHKTLGNPTCRIAAQIHWAPVFGGSLIVLLFAILGFRAAIIGAVSISLAQLVFSLVFTDVCVGPNGLLSVYGFFPWDRSTTLDGDKVRVRILGFGPKIVRRHVAIPDRLQEQIANYKSQSLETP